MRIDTASRDPPAFAVPENGAFAREPPAPRRHDGPPVASLSSALGGEDRAYRAMDLTTLVTALPTDDELALPDNVDNVPLPRVGPGHEYHRQSPNRRGASTRRAGSSTSFNASASGPGPTGHLPARGDHVHPGPHPANQHSNVYVKNLADDVDEPALQAAFGRFGAVESCCVIRDVSTNASRGFGFVKFATVAQAASAIGAMHGAHVRLSLIHI